MAAVDDLRETTPEPVAATPTQTAVDSVTAGLPQTIGVPPSADTVGAVAPAGSFIGAAGGLPIVRGPSGTAPSSGPQAATPVEPIRPAAGSVAGTPELPKNGNAMAQARALPGAPDSPSIKGSEAPDPGTPDSNSGQPEGTSAAAAANNATDSAATPTAAVSPGLSAGIAPSPVADAPVTLFGVPLGEGWPVNLTGVGDWTRDFLALLGVEVNEDVGSDTLTWLAAAGFFAGGAGLGVAVRPKPRRPFARTPGTELLLASWEDGNGRHPG